MQPETPVMQLILHRLGSHVDLREGILEIKKSKFGKDRLVPMSESTTEVCRRYYRTLHRYSSLAEHFFMQSSGRPVTRDNVYRRFREILWESGSSHGGKGSGPRMHDLRHTFAVHALKRAVDRGIDINCALPILSTYMGHASVTATEDPEHLLLCQQILSIPMKRSAKANIQYLTLQAIKAILEVPDPSCFLGRRDIVLLSLMYDTGARVQEIADLTVADVRLDLPPTIKVTGKGNKSRLVPLMTPTAKLLNQYLIDHDLKSSACRSYPLFQNRSREKLTRAGIAYLLDNPVLWTGSESFGFAKRAHGNPYSGVVPAPT